MIAVQGPNAREKVWQALPDSEAATARAQAVQRRVEPSASCSSRAPATPARTASRSSCPAAHAEALWHALAAAGVAPCGLGARDTLRLEAGMNLYGQDMDETVSPLEAGLAWTVDLRARAISSARRRSCARRRSAQLTGLLLLDAGGVLRAHQNVHTARGDGEITSGTFSPTLERSIAFARVPAGVAAGRHRARRDPRQARSRRAW